MEFSSNTNAKYTENPQWDIPGKNQTGGLRIWNFQGYQRNSMWNFQVLIKDKVESPSLKKKSNVEFQGVLVFGLRISN